MKRKIHNIKRPNVTSVTKVTFFMLLLFVTNMNATVLKVQNEMVVSVNLKNKPLDKVFETITKSSGYRFFYETSEIDVHKKIKAY